MKKMLLVGMCLLALGLSSYSFSETDSKGEEAQREEFSLSGRVISPVDAAGPVTLKITGPVSRSLNAGPDGSFTFSGLTRGTYTLTPEKSGYGFLPPKRTVTVGDEDVRAQGFSALRKFFIAGRVAKADGSPVQGAEVVLNNKVNAETLTDTDGNYAFELVGNGACTVFPRKAGMKFMPTKTTLSISGDSRSGIDFISAR